MIFNLYQLLVKNTSTSKMRSILGGGGSTKRGTPDRVDEREDRCFICKNPPTPFNLLQYNVTRRVWRVSILTLRSKSCYISMFCVRV